MVRKRGKIIKSLFGIELDSITTRWTCKGCRPKTTNR